jgi:hypothetical protein
MSSKAFRWEERSEGFLVHSVQEGGEIRSLMTLILSDPRQLFHANADKDFR